MSRDQANNPSQPTRRLIGCCLRGQHGFSAIESIITLAALALVGTLFFQYAGDSTRFQKSLQARSIDQAYEGLLRHQIYAFLRGGIQGEKVWPQEWERLRPTEGPSFAMMPFSPLGVVQLLSRLALLPETSDTRRLLLGSLEERLHTISWYSRKYDCGHACISVTALPFPYGVHFAAKLEGASGLYQNYNVFGIFSVHEGDHMTPDSLDIRYTLAWFAEQVQHNSNAQVLGTSFRFSLPTGGDLAL